MSGIGQYLTIFTSQLVKFLGCDFQSFGPFHIVFFIKIGPNNYLNVTNVDRNEPRGSSSIATQSRPILGHMAKFGHFKNHLPP
jgi:hypothetical protein